MAILAHYRQIANRSPNCRSKYTDDRRTSFVPVGPKPNSYNEIQRNNSQVCLRCVIKTQEMNVLVEADCGEETIEVLSRVEVCGELAREKIGHKVEDRIDDPEPDYANKGFDWSLFRSAMRDDVYQNAKQETPVNEHMQQQYLEGLAFVFCHPPCLTQEVSNEVNEHYEREITHVSRFQLIFVEYHQTLKFSLGIVHDFGAAGKLPCSTTESVHGSRTVIKINCLFLDLCIFPNLSRKTDSFAPKSQPNINLFDSVHNFLSN